MKENGFMTNTMDRELKPGKKKMQDLQGNFIWELRTEEENSNGRMDLIMKGTL
jgi:hypothetical protein